MSHPPTLPRRLLLTGAAASVAAPALAQRAFAPPQVIVRPSATTAGRAATQASSQPMLIMTGTQGGTFVRMGDDLATVMADAGLELRAEGSHGSLDNVHKLLTQRGVDLALVAADTLAYARTFENLPGVNRLQYIAKLGTNDLHLVARDPAIQAIGDLAGQRVVVDAADSGTAVTAPAVFRASGIAFTPVYETPRRGLEMLKHGEVAAVAYGIGKPGDLFLGQPQGSLHFVAAPMVDALVADYLPQTFGAADYPNLIAEGSPVAGISVGVALACFGWTTAPSEVARYQAVERFVRLFVGALGTLQKPPFHAQWQGVNLGAMLPGWTRFATVEAALAAAQAGGDTAFGAFLASIGRAGASGAAREGLRRTFNELLPQR